MTTLTAAAAAAASVPKCGATALEGAGAGPFALAMFELPGVASGVPALDVTVTGAGAASTTPERSRARRTGSFVVFSNSLHAW